MSLPLTFLNPTTTHNISVSGTTAKNSSDFASRAVYVQSTVDCRIKFGGSTVTAALTDMPIFSGVVYPLDTGGNLRIAAISAGTGTLSVTEMV